ncbi:hypothetical protein [Bradyrhizobium sp. 6(2017)]|uniref:hypothetical protein n=1 Tax=Bradyrhizobium sp. 6(2017) TaxID=1197460 RepID=UPI0013E1CA01|nr:hypothetical protein [Bradyrhizobium sp. 6(2017)]QIG92873.1 hypothetical protein G6P99_10380 [Bradyrhizobium sp. 6(2017)]
MEGWTLHNENKVVSCKTVDNGTQDNQGLTEETQNALLLGNTAALVLYNDINACQSPAQLDAVVRLIYEKYGAGLLNDDQASYLHSCVTRRRPVSQRTITGKFAKIGTLNGRVSRFLPRQRQRSPDRKASRDRRRMLGGSSALPDNLRHYYTEGQRAVLCIVAGEIKRQGVCDLPIDKIAALAGVCRTTVQTAMHEARRLSHIKITERPVRGRKHLSNLVEIVSPEWRTWIKRGPSSARAIGSKPVILVSTTKNTVRKKEGLGDELERGRGSGPPQTLMRRSA